jgi:hypothetical protein
MIFLFIFWLILFFPIVFLSNPLFDDNIESFYPNFYFITEQLKNLKLPLFNPYFFSGYPTINDVQLFELNPLFLIRNFIGIFNNSIYVFNLLISLNYLLALIFSYLYFKKLKFKNEIAILGSIIFAFSTCYVFTVIHAPTYDFIPFVPLVLYFLNDKPYLSALFMGFAFHSGHPQKPIYLLILIFIIFFFKILENKKEIFKFILFLIVFLPFVLSFYFQGIDLFTISKRVENDVKFLLEMSYHFDRLITLIIPKFYGSIENEYVGGPYYFYTEMTFYFTIIGLLLAIYGSLKNYKDKFVLSIIISAFLLFLLALGDQNFIIKFLYESGIIKGIRNPSRALFIYPIIVSILACYGLNSILKEKSLKQINYIILAFLLIFILFLPLAPKEIDISNEIFKFFIFLAISYILIYGFLKKVLSEKLFLYSVILLAFFDFYLISGSYLKIRRFENVYSYYSPDFVNQLKPNSLGEYRINSRFFKGLTLPRNSGSINKLELMEGYDPLVSKFYIEFYDYIIKRNEGFENLLKMANVKYYITDSGFLELKNYLPRAYIVHCVKVVKDSFEFFSNVKSLEPEKCVYLSEKLNKNYSLEKSYENVKIFKYNPNEILLEYETDEDGILVLSVNYYPYWKAELDDNKVKILRANWTFMAVEAPKGKHVVKFYYDKTKFFISLGFWIFGIILSLIFALYSKYIDFSEDLMGQTPKAEI